MSKRKNRKKNTPRNPFVAEMRMLKSGRHLDRKKQQNRRACRGKQWS